MKEKKVSIKPMEELNQFKIDNVQDVEYNVQQDSAIDILPQEIRINKKSWKSWEKVSLKLKKRYT